ncbi:MAG TPA: hypothetical protein VJ901_03900 [Thermoanaerobaculia bacterium]|nr:hypothetical protein [Thermoanaerobaculia bacterium]
MSACIHALDLAAAVRSLLAYVTRGDFRLNPEQPPPVKLWAGAFAAPMYKLPALRWVWCRTSSQLVPP